MRLSLRRRQAAVGVVGLAAVFSGGTFAVVQVLDIVSDRVVPAPAPATSLTPSPSLAEAGSTPDPPGRSGDAVWTRPSPTPRTTPSPTAFVDAVRPSPTAWINTGQAVTRTPDGMILRVVWARHDLTGRKELAWVADAGVAVGDARCTQRFRFMASGPVEVQPRLLMCWRTSAAKSVYTVAVAASGRPSRAASVAVLNARWTALSS